MRPEGKQNGKSPPSGLHPGSGSAALWLESLPTLAKAGKMSQSKIQGRG